jgi:hypothetical protein
MEPRRSWITVAIGIITAFVPTAVYFFAVSLLFPVPLLLGIFIICLGLATDRRRTTTFAVIALTACAWIGTCAVTAYLDRSGPPIEFVVPSGFHGTIEIIRDRRNGENLKFEHGRYVVVVPPSGVIRLKDAPPVYHWHEESCRDTDGHPRKLEGKGTTVGSHQIGSGRYEGNEDLDGTSYRWEVD